MAGPPRDLPLGRVHGHRGVSGEITVRVSGGEAALWLGLTRVRLGASAGDPATLREVESSRAYRDRLVLKLRGIDSATEAAALRGRVATVPRDAAPRLPDGRYWRSDLEGLVLWDEDGRRVGAVRGVQPTPAGDLLEVERDGGEILVPMVPEIVLRVEPEAGRIVVRLPPGLEDMNRDGGGGGASRC